MLAQPEVALGIIPGGSGTQRLPRLLGRARALEIILGCDDIPADLAERWGYVNRALPPAELRPFVERLALRIASFPASAIALAKGAVDAADPTVEPGCWRRPTASTSRSPPRRAGAHGALHGRRRTDGGGREGYRRRAGDRL